MEDHLLQFVFEGHRAADDLSARRAHFHVADGQIRRVEHDLLHRLVHGDVDPHRSRERGRSHVGLDLYAIDVRLHGPGQAERVL
jgi:hypothetical protein